MPETDPSLTRQTQHSLPRANPSNNKSGAARSVVDPGGSGAKIGQGAEGVKENLARIQREQAEHLGKGYKGHNPVPDDNEKHTVAGVLADQPADQQSPSSNNEGGPLTGTEGTEPQTAPGAGQGPATSSPTS